MTLAHAAGRAFAHDTLAVVVLYGRGLGDSPTFRTLDASLDDTGGRMTALVYDNSPAAAPLPLVDASRWELYYTHDSSNPGVSTAYRAGADLAARLGKHWLLFLDQDTVLPVSAVGDYGTATAAYPTEVLLAPTLVSHGRVVSPCLLRGLRGRPQPAPASGRHMLAGVSVLNSGMCVALTAYRAAGGHDPAIPLDFSDHEFVARLRRVCDSYVALGTPFVHGLSANESPSVADQLVRFRAYCRGAVRTQRGPISGLAAQAYVVGRGAVLAWRGRRWAFVRIALHAVGRRG